MSEVRADIDGIRALGAFAQRQGEHVRNVEDYLYDNCLAEGAFDGVLGFFAGTYATALRNAQEGLQGAVRTHAKIAGLFEECAGEYEAADRGAYDGLVRVGSGIGWEFDPYRPVGS